MNNTLFEQARSRIEALIERADKGDANPLNSAGEISSIHHLLMRAVEEADKQRRLTSPVMGFRRGADIDHANAMAAQEQDEAAEQYAQAGGWR